MIARSVLCMLTLVAIPLEKADAEPPPIVQAEVGYLLNLIGASDCTFYRNGSWYDGKRATAHLRTKFDYLVARNQIGTTEDFINKGATKSSLSGQSYKIRCGAHAEVDSSAWLREALARYRESGNPPP